MAKELEYILKKFPDHRARIIIMYNQDEDFRTLCEDYYSSAMALEEHRINTTKDKAIENEFATVYVELEKEITQVLGTNMK